MCRTERILHLSSSVTISEVTVKPEAEKGRHRGQKKKKKKGRQARRIRCNGVIDASTGWMFLT